MVILGLVKLIYALLFTEWALTTFSSFRYWHEDRLLQRLREGISDGQGDYYSTLSLLIDDPLVIIDDVGCNKPNEWREEVLFHTIDTRYNSTLPTIFTTNLTREEFSTKYHHRIYSRLFATENTIIEIHNATDLRKDGK